MSDPEIVIDPAFQKLLPPLTKEEYEQLEKNILEEKGCRDALVVWQHEGKSILIDGHNRYEICQKHGIHQFDVVEMEFASREAVEDWIDANQLGRRSLSPDARKLALGRLYNRTKKPSGWQKGNARKHDGALPDSVAANSTADAIAEKFGVSPRTVERAGAFAKEVSEKPELAEAITNGVPVVKVKREQAAKGEKPKQMVNLTLLRSQMDRSMKVISVGIDQLLKADPSGGLHHSNCRGAYTELYNFLHEWRKRK